MEFEIIKSALLQSTNLESWGVMKDSDGIRDYTTFFYLKDVNLRVATSGSVPTGKHPTSTTFLVELWYSSTCLFRKAQLDSGKYSNSFANVLSLIQSNENFA